MRSNKAKYLLRYIDHSNRIHAIELLDYLIDLEIIFADCYKSLSINKIASFNKHMNQIFTAIELLANNVK